MSLPASISAVLPCYNEVAVIGHTVTGTLASLERCGVRDHEVVVVDDGSSDGSGELLRRLLQEEPRLRVLTHDHNRGYGAALRTGFEGARSEAVWLLDSDGQFDPADLALLLPAYRRDTVVAGFRRHRNDPLLRRLYHNAFFALVRLLFGPTVRDVNCAFKLFPRAVGTGLHSEGAMVSTELVLRARRAGYRFVEPGVPHHPRRAGTPTGANPRVVLRAFVELVGLLRHRDALDRLAAPPAAGDEAPMPAHAATAP